jgi:hypothetical protein
MHFPKCGGACGDLAPPVAPATSGAPFFQCRRRGVGSRLLSSWICGCCGSGAANAGDDALPNPSQRRGSVIPGIGPAVCSGCRPWPYAITSGSSGGDLEKPDRLPGGRSGRNGGTDPLSRPKADSPRTNQKHLARYPEYPAQSGQSDRQEVGLSGFPTLRRCRNVSGRRGSMRGPRRISSPGGGPLHRNRGSGHRPANCRRHLRGGGGDHPYPGGHAPGSLSDRSSGSRHGRALSVRKRIAANQRVGNYKFKKE